MFYYNKDNILITEVENEYDCDVRVVLIDFGLSA